MSLFRIVLFANLVLAGTLAENLRRVYSADYGIKPFPEQRRRLEWRR